MNVISFGSVCYVKELLRCTSYNKETDIFDWFNTFYFSKMINSIVNNFNIFDNIKLNYLDVDIGKSVLYNDIYDFRMPHEESFFYNKNCIIEKYDRRFERFINYKKSNDNFLFVRIPNLKGRYGKEAEVIKYEYSKEHYDKLMKYLPEKSHILLLCDEVLEESKRNEFYEKFIVLDNIIHPGFMAGHEFKEKYLFMYKTFLNFCNDNFDNLLNLQNEANKFIAKD